MTGDFPMAKIQEICMMEGSRVGDRTDRAMNLCGCDKVCEKYGVPFMLCIAEFGSAMVY